MPLTVFLLVTIAQHVKTFRAYFVATAETVKLTAILHNKPTVRKNKYVPMNVSHAMITPKAIATRCLNVILTTKTTIRTKDRFRFNAEHN